MEGMFEAEEISGSLEELKRKYAAHGVRELLVKTLTARQNSRNQFYLGAGFEILNDLPMFEFKPELGGTHERTGKERLKARLDLSWLDHEGRTWPAPNAQVILYPQYPEIRLGGSSSRSPFSPDSHRGRTELRSSRKVEISSASRSALEHRGVRDRSRRM